jgi:hypothetical protein
MIKVGDVVNLSDSNMTWKVLEIKQDEIIVQRSLVIRHISHSQVTLVS